MGERVGRAARPRNSGRSSVRRIVPLATFRLHAQGDRRRPGVAQPEGHAHAGLPSVSGIVRAPRWRDESDLHAVLRRRDDYEVAKREITGFISVTQHGSDDFGAAKISLPGQKDRVARGLAGEADSALGCERDAASAAAERIEDAAGIVVRKKADPR